MIADVMVLNVINTRGNLNHEKDLVKELMRALNGMRPNAMNWDEQTVRSAFMEKWSNFDYSKIKNILEDESLPREFKPNSGGRI